MSDSLSGPSSQARYLLNLSRNRPIAPLNFQGVWNRSAPPINLLRSLSLSLSLGGYHRQAPVSANSLYRGVSQL